MNDIELIARLARRSEELGAQVNELEMRIHMVKKVVATYINVESFDNPTTTSKYESELKSILTALDDTPGD